MADWKKYTGTTVDEAFTKACIDFGMPSSELEMVVTQNESAGFLGLFKKEAEIQVRVKKKEQPQAKTPVKEEEAEKPVKKEQPVKAAEKPAEVKKAAEQPAKKEEKKPEKKAEEKKPEAPKEVVKEKAPEKAAAPAAEPEKPARTASLPSNVDVVDFLKDVLGQMGIDAEVTRTMDEENETMNIEIEGSNMGLLIGKRGQTLDALQYLASLIVNKGQENYVKVKVDTENYRERRKATLENLAKNISSKVKKTHRAVTLEPMNPYERRIIHAALQNDRYVETHSEGDEPNRSVVVTLKKEFKDYDFGSRRGYGGKKFNNNRGGQNRKNGRYNNNRRYNNRKDGGRENRENAPAADKATE